MPNMVILKPSREKRLPGDVFTYHIPAAGWLFGRIIRTDAKMFDKSKFLLIYTYKPVVKDPSNVPALRRDELLIPPEIIGSSPWTLGYFKRVRREPLKPSDVLPRHCFFNESVGRYFDEYNDEVKPSKPFTIHGLLGYRSFDHAVSEALGIPLAVDDPVVADSPHDWVIVNIPAAGGDLDATSVIYGFEDDLIRAIRKTKSGKFDGHGFDLGKGVFDARFYGPDAEAMLNAMHPVLARWRDKSSPGSWLTIRRPGRKEDRIEL